MPRPTNQPNQIPGAAPGTQSASADTQTDDLDLDDGQDQPIDAEDKDALIAKLQAQLADHEAKDKLPQVVSEPTTPHGAIALAQSAFAGMTVAELMAGIDAGKYREPPVTSVLCSDGWYARRGNSL
jgi:hypothetical protein